MTEALAVPTHKPWRAQIEDVTQTRRNANGKPLLNFLRVAIAWTHRLANQGKLTEGKFIDPEDVCWMMVEFKEQRQINTFQDDNGLDAMGYLDCLNSIHDQMRDLGYAEGAEAFRSMTLHQLEALRDRLISRQTSTLNFLALPTVLNTAPTRSLGTDHPYSKYEEISAGGQS